MIGLHGDRRKLDVGRFNGERFAVMAGAGFDAAMIGQADGTLKDRFGRAAYVWTGSQNLRVKPFKAKIKVDGAPWYAGAASCILFGNVGRLFGGVEVFQDACPDDGRLETRSGQRRRHHRLDACDRAHGRRSVGAIAARPGDHGEEDQGQAQPQGLYEVDGGDRAAVKSFKVRVEPRAITDLRPRQEEFRMTDQQTISPVREARSAGEGFVHTQGLRGALACRLRRTRARLRNHRAARTRPRSWSGRQDHESARRPSHDRAPALRPRSSSAGRGRAWGLLPLEALSGRARPRSRGCRHDARASRCARERDRLRADLRPRRRDPAQLRWVLRRRKEDDEGRVRASRQATGSLGSRGS